jgi:hypothetical protein
MLRLSLNLIKNYSKQQLSCNSKALNSNLLQHSVSANAVQAIFYRSVTSFFLRSKFYSFLLNYNLFLILCLI